MKYKVIWLSSYNELESFNGKIIEVLDKQHIVDEHEDYWNIQCLVKLREEKEKKL